MTIEERATQLAADLDADETAIREDLENLITYSVPIEEAVKSLRRKYGRPDESPGEPSALEVDEIDVAHDAVSVTVRVLSAGRRSIQFDGEERVITEGQLADTSGRISFTAWQEFEFDTGDSITIENAGVREWNGEPELNLGAQSRLSSAGSSVETSYEFGGVSDVSALTPGDRDVTIEVRIIEVEQRSIDGRHGETIIHSGVLGDGSGRLPFTDWEAREGITEGASVRVENAYVREFRGIPSVNFSEFSRVTPIDAVEVAPAGERRSIVSAVETEGMYDVELRGTVVDIRDGSGLIERCPECRRVLRAGQCRTHGDVDGEDDLRVKAVLDDGTGAATVVLDRDLTEAVYGDDLAAALEAARAAMDQGVVATRVRERILGRVFRARGQLSVDEYGANLEAEAFDADTDEPAAQARQMLGEVTEST